MTVGGLAIHVAIKELIVVPATFLGVIHRSVGMGEKRFGIPTAVWVRADANTGGHAKTMLIDLLLLPQLKEDLLGANGGIGGAPDFGQQDHEFVAALTAHRV